LVFALLALGLLGRSTSLAAQDHRPDRPVTPLCVSGCPAAVSVTPDSGSVGVEANSGAHTVTFFVTNTGTTSGSYALTCSAVKVTCGTVTPASATLPANGTIDVDVSFTVGSRAGAVTLTASGPATDTGTYAVVIVAPGAPTVALPNQNGDNLDRGLCLTTGAGEAAGISCGDLFVVHGMPAYRTLGRDRSLTLLYNSATATGLVLVAAQVSQPGGTAVPTSVTLVLTVGTAKDSAQFAAVPAGQTQQMVVGRGITGLATGVYPMTLTARNVYAGGVYETTVSGSVLVVNRSASEFGKGWALMGLEQILTDPTDSARRVWVAGDGSIRLYTQAVPGSNTFLGAPGDAPDSLVRFLNGGNLWYRRQLKHGVTVEFDQAGRHQSTTNRVGAITSFYWSGTSPARLDSITVPPNDAVRRTYRLFWNGGTALLDSIRDPGGRRLKSTMTGGALAALTDPDNQTTRFNYTNNLLTKRIYPRKGMTGDSASTSYVYANSARVTAVNIQTDSAATLFAVTTLTPWDERGLAAPYGTTSSGVPTSSAGLPTRVDGPISGTGDASDILVNRFGQPTQITQLGLNTVTQIFRDSTASLPALVTRVVYPHPTTPGAPGRTVHLSWNTRGNLVEVQDSTCRKLAGCAPAQVTTTTYQYGDQAHAPDSPTRVTDALGRYTQIGYTSLGLTDHVIDPRLHQTQFWYTATGPLTGMMDSVAERLVETWKTTQPDTGFVLADQTTRFLYDANGNLTRMISPLGVTTSYVPDALGRTTAVYDPLGSRTTYTYDLQNRVTLTVQDSAKQAHPGGIDPLGPPCDSQQILCTDLNQAPTAGPTLTAHYYYGPVGLDSVADPRGVMRGFRYDARGTLVQERDAFAQGRTSVFDQAGLLLRTLGRVNAVTPHQDTVRYTYDGLGRRTSMALSATPAAPPNPGDVVPRDSVSYTYDLLNRMLSDSNRQARILRSYYDDGTLRTQVTVLPTGRDSAAYDYDASGARTSVRRTWSVTGATDVFTYTYNAAGDLASMVATWAGGTPAPTTILFTMDGLGRRHRLDYPHGITVTLRYDAGGVLRRQVVSNPQPGIPQGFDNLDVSYQADSVDALGRALHLHWICGGRGVGSPCDSSATARDQHTRYDRYGWVASSCCHSATEIYRYDRSGNRLARLLGSNSHYYTYANAPAVSNVLVRDSTAGQSSALVTQFGTNANGARTGEFKGANTYKLFYYDALGRNAGVRDFNYSSSGHIDCNLFNPDGQLFRTCDDNSPRQIFDGHNVAALDAERWVFLTGPGLDDPLVGLYRKVGGALLYVYVTDGQGRQLAVAREGGTMIDNDEQWYLFNGGKFAGGTTNAQSFTASRMEGVATAPGISYFRNRAYDQSTGRWLQEDPTGIAGGLNLYQFNGNDPNTYTDPFGLDPCKSSPAWTECIAQAIADWGARRGGISGSIALSAGAALNAGLEASLLNAAASAGNDIGSGHVGRGLLVAGLTVGGGAIGTGLRGASLGLRSLFAESGGLSSKTIIGIRSILRENGFVMGLAESKQGYLFTNEAGEQVRIMRGDRGWYARIRNAAGNYLDEVGNPGDRASTHLPVDNR